MSGGANGNGSPRPVQHGGEEKKRCAPFAARWAAGRDDVHSQGRTGPDRMAECRVGEWSKPWRDVPVNAVAAVSAW